MGMRNINTPPGVKGGGIGWLLALPVLACLMIVVVAIGNNHTSTTPTPTPAVSTTQQPQPTHSWFCWTCGTADNPWFPSPPPDWWQPGMPTQSPTKAG